VCGHELDGYNLESAHQAPIGEECGVEATCRPAYIEEHLYEQISLATLAQLVRLSFPTFLPGVKQSVGHLRQSPHRYQRAAASTRQGMLAKPTPSVKEIGMTVGFQRKQASPRPSEGKINPTELSRSLG